MDLSFWKQIKKTVFLKWTFGFLFILVPFGIQTSIMAGTDSVKEFIAVLDGKNQVPSIETPATGKALFKFDEAKKIFNYKVTVNKIEDVVSAQLHLGKPGMNGPMVAKLAGPFPPGKGQLEGVLAEGSFGVPNLVGPMLPEPTGEDDSRLLAELLSNMRNGKFYVNVVTDPGWDPSQNRPGRFPKNEIRGQIMPVED